MGWINSPDRKVGGIFSSPPPQRTAGSASGPHAPRPSLRSGTQDTPAAPVPSLVPRSELQRNAALLRGRSFLAQPRRGCPLRFLATPGAYACGPPSGAPRAAPCGPGRPRRFAGPVRRLRPRFARRARPPSLPPGSLARPPLRPRFAAGSGGSRCPRSPAAPSAPLRAPAACALVALALLRVGFGLRVGRRVPPARAPSGLRGGCFLAGGQAAASGCFVGFAPRLFAAFGRCSQRSLLRLARPCGQCCGDRWSLPCAPPPRRPLRGLRGGPVPVGWVSAFYWVSLGAAMPLGPRPARPSGAVHFP
jgi:hypothetical protein